MTGVSGRPSSLRWSRVRSRSEKSSSGLTALYSSKPMFQTNTSRASQKAYPAYVKRVAGNIEARERAVLLVERKLRTRKDATRASAFLEILMML